jgi:regulator of RNase E activity RraB
MFVEVSSLTNFDFLKCVHLITRAVQRFKKGCSLRRLESHEVNEIGCILCCECVDESLSYCDMDGVDCFVLELIRFLDADSVWWICLFVKLTSCFHILH